MSSGSSTLELFASLTAAEREAVLAELVEKHGVPAAVLKARLLGDWKIVGRQKQQPPPGAWTYWWMRAGRRWGKNRTAAEWAKAKALERPVRFALVARTFGDVRDTVVEGESGLLSVIPVAALRGQSREHAWNRSLGELMLANGSVFKAYSSETPDRLRGPQHDYAVADEISSWADAWRGDVENTTWSNLKLSTSGGEHPQIVITSTPKPNKLTKQLAAIPPPRMRMVIGTSYENRENLPDSWWDEVIAPYMGTRIGMQEIEAQILEDVEGALWTRAVIDSIRVEAHPDLARIVVGVDPNVSSSEAANEAGIIVAGRAHPPRSFGYVLADRTPLGGGPAAWAQAAVDAYREFEADLIVAEKNNGGDMVEMVLKTVDANVPVKLVSATRGKRTRAEPVASRYTGSHASDGTVVVEPTIRHVGVFEELETQLCEWTPESESPDRLDALVWAMWELMGADPPRSWAAVPRARIPGVDGRGGLVRQPR